MFHKQDKPATHLRTYEKGYGREYNYWQRGNMESPLRWRHAGSQGFHNGGESWWLPVHVALQRPIGTS